MADAATAEDPPAPTPEHWRDGLEAWARAIFRLYRAHPWLLQMAVGGPPAGPAQLRWMEAGLANLHRLLGTGILDDPSRYDDDADFGFGLATILAGVAQQVAASQTADA